MKKFCRVAIKSGTRTVIMNIEKPIPSFGVIHGQRFVITHPGQQRTWSRCNCTGHLRDACPNNNRRSTWAERIRNVVTGDSIKKPQQLASGAVEAPRYVELRKTNDGNGMETNEALQSDGTKLGDTITERKQSESSGVQNHQTFQLSTSSSTGQSVEMKSNVNSDKDSSSTEWANQ